jgi:hypothetical protein
MKLLMDIAVNDISYANGIFSFFGGETGGPQDVDAP